MRPILLYLAASTVALSPLPKSPQQGDSSYGSSTACPSPFSSFDLRALSVSGRRWLPRHGCHGGIAEDGESLHQEESPEQRDDPPRLRQIEMQDGRARCPGRNELQ